jgi:hypothetical protein
MTQLFRLVAMSHLLRLLASATDNYVAGAVAKLDGMVVPTAMTAAVKTTKDIVKDMRTAVKQKETIIKRRRGHGLTGTALEERVKRMVQANKMKSQVRASTCKTLSVHFILKHFQASGHRRRTGLMLQVAGCKA